jgi:hypothetical protein
MTYEEILDLARKYASDDYESRRDELSYVVPLETMHHVCKLLIELHDADQAPRNRRRSIGRKGGKSNRPSLRRDIQRN